MLTKSTRRPAPALIVATVALVAALAGSAVALPGKNSVQSNDIKKNAIRSKHVKKDALKGADIKESTLAQVPSAAKADSAGSIEGSARVWKKVTPSTSAPGFHEARLAAAKVPLGGAGPFTVYGKCFIEEGVDRIVGAIYIETSEPGGILSGSTPEVLFGNLNPDTDENDRELDGQGKGLNQADGHDYGDFNAIAASGAVLSGDVGVFVKHGTLATGDGAFGPGDVCIFRYEQRPLTALESG